MQIIDKKIVLDYSGAEVICMAVTIKDIAKAAGVSPSTVSRVIKDHYSISLETKSKIRTIMDEMGYSVEHPQVNVKTIGVVFPKAHYDSFENPFYLEMIRGIGLICNQRNYTMNIITGANDKEIRTSIHNSKADGYIFLYSDVEDKLVNYMHDKNYLFVLIGKPTTRISETLCVDTDNIQAGYEAVQHLISLGHKRIGYIGTDEKRVFSNDRRIGYIQAMHDNNLEIENHFVHKLSAHSTYNHDNLIHILKQENRPTAFVVCDDIYAMTLQILAKIAELNVPEDLSIVSFNNTLFSKMNDYTSFDINANQLGIEAASQIIKHIENPHLYATRIIVPHYLIQRNSTKKIKQE